MDIPSPQLQPTDDEYDAECQEALDLPVRDLIDRAIIAGWEPRRVFKAVAEVARSQGLAYEEGPDPSGL